MLYKTLKRQIEKYVLTNELKGKIDMFYLADRLTEEQYKDLMGIRHEEDTEEPVEVTEEAI